MNGVEYYPHENTANGVNGIMPIETFVYEPVQRLRHRRRFPQCNLIFDHHMGHCVKLGGFKLHPGADPGRSGERQAEV